MTDPAALPDAAPDPAAEPAGARPVLHDWLAARKESRAAFAARAGLHRQEVWAFCQPFDDPNFRRPSPEKLALIVAATDGEAGADWFFPPELRVGRPAEAAAVTPEAQP